MNPTRVLLNPFEGFGPYRSKSLSIKNENTAKMNVFLIRVVKALNHE